jgi:hypothetical protein
MLVRIERIGELRRVLRVRPQADKNAAPIALIRAQFGRF